MERYTIMQDVDGHVEQGFYMVFDKENKLVNYFQFRKEAEAYAKAIRKQGINNVNPSEFNAEIR
jgi:hypothetical protein